MFLSLRGRTWPELCLQLISTTVFHKQVFWVAGHRLCCNCLLLCYCSAFKLKKQKTKKPCFLRKAISETSHFHQASPSRCQDGPQPAVLCSHPKIWAFLNILEDRSSALLFSARSRTCPLMLNASPQILRSCRKTPGRSLTFYFRSPLQKNAHGSLLLFSVTDNCFSNILKYSPILYSLISPVGGRTAKLWVRPQADSLFRQILSAFTSSVRGSQPGGHPQESKASQA